MSIDGRNVEGGIIAITADLPPHIEECTAEAVEALDTLDAALQNIAEPPVASIREGGDLPFVVDIAPHATREQLKEITRTINEHVDEDSEAGIQLIVVELPHAIGRVSLNLLDYMPQDNISSTFREIVKKCVDESLDTLRSALNPTSTFIDPKEVQIGSYGFPDQSNTATEVSFTVEFLPEYPPTAEAVRVVGIIADHIAAVRTRPLAAEA